MRSILAILLLTVTISVDGQLLDSMRYSYTLKPKFYAKLDTRNSFVTNIYSKVRGVKVGLNYGDITRMGIGYSWLGGDFEKKISINNAGVDETVIAHLKMGYFTPYVEYTYFRSGRWESTIPVQFNIGKTWLNYNGENLSSGWSILYEPAMTVQYRVIRYLAIGLGIGYRLELLRNDRIGENLTSPIYLFRSKVFLGRIWADLFGRE